MKKWKCTVCGYIHVGEEPPEKCPQCGAPKEKFILLDSAQDGTGATTGASDTIREADILVVGSGAAAFTAAATARLGGASVIMLEKGGSIGGTTIRSGGGFWIPNNRFQREAGVEDRKEDAMRYMARYSFPGRYNPEDEKLGLPDNAFELIEAYYDNASAAVDYLEEHGVITCIQDINWTGKPQVDYQDHLPENKGIRGRSIFTKDSEGKLGFGYELVSQFERFANENDIPVLLNHEVTKILRNENGKVTGLEVLKNDTETLTFTAKKGVIFGSGGYSHNDEYMRQFQPAPHYGGCSAPTNTGDFITMAMEIGAKIGNTANAFRAESILEGVLENPDGSNNVFYVPGDSVIEVNKYGQRYVNEKRNYTDRTMTHMVWDPQNAEWPNMITFLLYDQRTANFWMGFPPYPVPGSTPSYLISGDTLEELTAEIAARLEKIKTHTGGFGLDDAFLENLKETVSRFNRYAESGKDEEFGRGETDYDREWTTFPPTMPGAEWPPKGTKNHTMYPLSGEGPYYAIMLAAGTLDTNGGPVIDKNARVLDARNRPIEGLYGAGNCIASPTANAYWGGGSTIGPAMAFGYIAARHALGK